MGLLDTFFKKKVLFFPGCAPKFLDKEVQERYKKILEKLGIEYVMLPKEEVCCGKPALDFGFNEEFRDLRDKNTGVFRENKIKKIITCSPGCYYTFKKRYEDVDIEIEYITQTILENIEKIDKKYEGQQITFFDPCNPHKVKELYEEPREILKKIGLRVENLRLCKEKSLCCGKALEHISPKVSKEMAQAILKQVKTKTLITTSTDCYLQFKELKNPNVRIREFSEVLL
jgi:heterodisulfide reductase subunit D